MHESQGLIKPRRRRELIEAPGQRALTGMHATYTHTRRVERWSAGQRHGEGEKCWGERILYRSATPSGQEEPREK